MPIAYAIGGAGVALLAIGIWMIVDEFLAKQKNQH